MNIPDLDALLLIEEGTYWESRLHLGDTALLFQLTSDCYENLVGTYSVCAEVATLTEDQTVLLYLLAGSKAEMGTGAQSLLRGHGADSMGHIRKAIEYGLFALNLFEHPGSAMKWIMANSDYKAYRDAFNILDMLHITTYETATEVEKGFASTLIDRYETCCVQVHATMYSAASCVEIRKSETGREFRFHSVDRQRGLDMVKRFIWMIDSHMTLVELYCQLLSRVFSSFKMSDVVPAIERTKDQIAECKNQWKPYLYPSGPPTANIAPWQLPKKDRKKRKPK